MKAILGFNETREYKPRKSVKNPNPVVEQQSLQKAMAREVVNIKVDKIDLLRKGLKNWLIK